MKRWLAGLGAVLFGVACVVVGRALPGPPERSAAGRTVAPGSDAVDAQAAAGRFAGGLRFRTITHPEEEAGEGERGASAAAFEAFHAYLEGAYPRVHGELEREVVGEHSLVYVWRGRHTALDPTVLMAHMDVVPVEVASESAWPHPAFEGRIADGAVWGRGALDDKGSLFAILEAVEALIAGGFAPRRTLILSFGHDEEGSKGGITAVVDWFEANGHHPHIVLDEGGAIAEGLLPGLDLAVAAVGVAEKGYVSVTLDVETAGGHSSAPPRETSIGILAGAVSRLETHPMPSHFEGPLLETLRAIGPHTGFGYRLVLQNLWLFSPLVRAALERIPQAGPVLRTTTAPTIFRAGVKDNVLPSRASAVVNFRVFPGDAIEDVLAHVERVVDDDRVKVDLLSKQREATSVSPIDGPRFALVRRAIEASFPDVIVAPHLIPGGTDSRYFRRLTDQVFGFMPFRLDADQLKSIHGIGEHLELESFAAGIDFYATFVTLADAGD